VSELQSREIRRAVPREQFSDLTASELYCPSCRRAQPVRERLLLLLPRGELREYRCVQCGGSLGTREITAAAAPAPVRRPVRRAAPPAAAMPPAAQRKMLHAHPRHQRHHPGV
jgi:uncharacterized protein YbaR (Trm112 family)